MPIPSVMEIRPDCPETLDATIRQMLAKRPEDRPQSMAEIIVALESCLEKPDAAPPPASQLPATSRPARTGWRTWCKRRPRPSTDRFAGPGSDASFNSRRRYSCSPLRTSGGGSTIRRAKQQTHRAGSEKARPAPLAAATPGRSSPRRLWPRLLGTAAVVALIFRPGRQ